MKPDVFFAACISSFILGFFALYLVASIFSRRRAGQHAKGTVTVSGTSVKKTSLFSRVRAAISGFFSRLGVMNLILVVVGVSVVLFTREMIGLFREYGAIPDNLCICFFSFVGGECGVMGWIKTTKERKQERKWQEEDRMGVNATPYDDNDLPKG